MKILLTRHGRTNYNDLGLCNSDPKVDVYLTQQGIEQAKELKAKLSRFSVKKVYVSDLPRTHETARYCIPKHVPLIQEPRISDIKTGFECQPVSDYLKYIATDNFFQRPPGGESLYDLKNRVHSFIEDIIQRSDDCILIITHMDPARIITGYFQALTDLEVWRLEIKNCELLEFDIA